MSGKYCHPSKQKMQPFKIFRNLSIFRPLAPKRWATEKKCLRVTCPPTDFSLRSHKSKTLWPILVIQAPLECAWDGLGPSFVKTLGDDKKGLATNTIFTRFFALRQGSCYPRKFAKFPDLPKERILCHDAKSYILRTFLCISCTKLKYSVLHEWDKYVTSY